jgi:hypothetical protein
VVSDAQRWIDPSFRRYRLSTLTIKEFDQLVRGPIEAAGKQIPDDALQVLRATILEGSDSTLLDDEIELVDLQVFCSRVWEAAEGPQITVRDVHSVGRLSDALTSFLKVGVLEASSRAKVSQRRIHAWLATELITSGGTRALVYYGDETTASLPNRAVRELVRVRVLNYVERSEGTWCELSHDSLVRPVLETEREVSRLARVSIGVGGLLAAAIIIVFGPRLISEPFQDSAADSTRAFDQLNEFARSTSELPPVEPGTVTVVSETPSAFALPSDAGLTIVTTIGPSEDVVILYTAEPFDETPSIYDDEGQVVSYIGGQLHGTRADSLVVGSAGDMPAAFALDVRDFTSKEPSDEPAFVVAGGAPLPPEGVSTLVEGVASWTVRVNQVATLQLELAGDGHVLLIGEFGPVSPLQQEVVQDGAERLARLDYALPEGEFLLIGRQSAAEFRLRLTGVSNVSD